MTLPLLNSIRWRLLIWMGSLLALVLGGFGFTAYELHRRNQLEQIDAQLQQRVSYLSSAVRRPPSRDRGDGPGGFRGPGGPGPRHPPPPEFHDGPDGPGPGIHGPGGRDGMRPPFDHDGPFESRQIELSGESLRLFDEIDTNAFYFAVWSRGGTLLKSSTNHAPELLIPSQVGRETSTHTRMRSVYREAYQFTERGDCVLAGISLAPYFSDLGNFKTRLGFTGLSVLVLGLGVTWWLATRAIQPLDEISATANRIAAGNLSERIAPGDTVTELSRLVGVLNSTFARLESSFARQKQFTADASHELRTPLAVIISESQTTLNRNRSGDEYREALKVCHDAAQQMRGLADALLVLARFDAGQQQLRREPVDLMKIAEDSVNLLRPLAREKNVSIDCDCQPAEIPGDVIQLTQVVTNLLHNAISYNKTGGRVTVITSETDSSAVLKVADTGIGIAPDDLPHIFERFYRADKARARNEGHTGLGLAIVRSIVELHQGSVEAKSTLDEGTTFHVTLPKSSRSKSSS